MPIFINKVYAPAEIAAFKAGVDAAKAVIAAQIPVVSEQMDKGLMPAERERAAFLPASYSVADSHPNLMTDAYNHGNHLISNNLVLVNADLISYVNTQLIEPLLLTKRVAGDYSVREGIMVLNAAEERGKTDATYKTIWSTLSALFLKKHVTPPAPPTP